jgi:hypothetical protein
MPKVVFQVKPSQGSRFERGRGLRAALVLCSAVAIGCKDSESQQGRDTTTPPDTSLADASASAEDSGAGRGASPEGNAGSTGGQAQGTDSETATTSSVEPQTPAANSDGCSGVAPAQASGALDDAGVELPPDVEHGSGDGGSSAEQPSPAPEELMGTVQILTEYFEDRHLIGARFYRRQESTADVTTEGACWLSKSTGQQAELIPSEGISAGTITFSATDLDDPTLSYSAQIMPMANGVYLGGSYGPTAMRGGEVGTVTASGDVVPAFEVALDLPVSLILTAPSAADTGELVLSRSSDTHLVWERGAEGVTLLVQGSYKGETETQSLGCRFDSTLGEGDLPASVLGAFGGSSLQFFTASQTTVDADGAEITVLTGRDVLVASKLAAVVGSVE